MSGPLRDELPVPSALDWFGLRPVASLDVPLLDDPTPGRWAAQVRRVEVLLWATPGVSRETHRLVWSTLFEHAWPWSTGVAMLVSREQFDDIERGRWEYALRGEAGDDGDD